MPERAPEERFDQIVDAVLAGASAEAAGEFAALAQIAVRLHEMPAQDFQSRLKTQLERRTAMTTTAAAPIREGFRTVTPYISIPQGGELIDFLKHTFGAEETGRHPSSVGFHAEVRIGDSMLMVGWGEPTRGHERIGAFHVYVPDCDAAWRRAIEAGATSTGEPADRPYGERSGFVRDLAGNQWYIATHAGPTFAPEGRPNLMPYVLTQSGHAFLDFVRRALGAEVIAVYEDGGRIMHSSIRIGDSVVEMGEPAVEPLTMPNRFFLYVDNCDRWYQTAIAAGATSVFEPANQPYGRAAMVLDPFGFEWGMASLP
jgi:uncharacterized glyoxalase superfamily protein PhnB